MTKDEILIALEEINRLDRQNKCFEAKSDILAFTQYTKQDYIVNWHHQILCDKLNRFANGEIKRMMVFMPPQHGKSELTSRRLPAYMLGRNPNLRIALCAYNSTFASKFNRQVQRIILEPAYKEVFPETRLNEKNVTTDSKGSYLRNSEAFEIVGKQGSFISVGVGGGITGNPVDIALIDDPIKGAEEAGSQTYREKIWEWYTTELETRLNNNSQILITLTRWNVDDIAGRILAASEQNEHSRDWEVVVFPRIKVDNSNPNDPRKIGEVLWEEIHSMESAMEAKSRNPVKFEALQQQNPKIMEAGSEFYKMFNLNRHTGVTHYDEKEPLHVSLDENVNPYITATIYQIKGNTVKQINELCLAHPKNTVKSLAAEFSMIYRNHTTGVFVYGDATSKKEDTKLEKGQNFFTLFCNYIRQFAPSLRLAKSNPPVAMRGNWVNELFENGEIEIIIGENCHNSIADFQFTKEDAEGKKAKTKVKDIRTGISYEKWGHCFVAGTKVLTNNGPVNIEDIKVGDLVKTRKGYKTVLRSGLTRENAIVKTYRIGKNEITCTPDHRIFTFNKGFKMACSLIGKNTFCIFDEKLNVWKRKRLFIKEVNLADTQTHKGPLIENILKVGSKKMDSALKSIYIDIFGNKKMEKFLKDITYTTKMVISMITILATFNVLLPASIWRTITRNYLKVLRNIRKRFCKNWHNRKQRNGINQNKAENGTKNTQKKVCLRTRNRLTVKNVILRLQQRIFHIQDFARKNVQTDTMQEKIGYQENGTKQESAPIAEKILKFTNGTNKNVAVNHVANVYDITVEDQHEFFANNILVHNCSDTFDYMMCRAFNREFILYQKGGRQTKMISSNSIKKRYIQ